MSFLLDTNICSAHFRRPGGLAHRYFQYSGRLFISTIVLGELYAWAYQRSNPTVILDAIADLLQDVAVLPFESGCARQFGILRGELRRRGIGVSHLDVMIAATALEHDLTLVTHNLADFQNIPGVRLVDWLAP